jgi:hypothetical protein
MMSHRFLAKDGACAMRSACVRNHALQTESTYWEQEINSVVRLALLSRSIDLHCQSPLLSRIHDTSHLIWS